MSYLLFYLTNGSFNHNYHSYEIMLNEENLKKKNKKTNKQVHSFLYFRILR